MKEKIISGIISEMLSSLNNEQLSKLKSTLKLYLYNVSDLPKEYTGSKYTNSMRGTNAKAKANATTGIPELIEIAVGKHFRTNKEDKHKRDGKNGWYRYDSRFALPVYGDDGEVERYNVFHASMLIRHSNLKNI